MSFLLDTCVISELVRSVPDQSVLRWIDERDEFDLYLSVLSVLPKKLPEKPPKKRFSTC